MKKCKECKEEKNLEKFGKRKSSKDGLHYTCKECINVITLLNKDKRQIYNNSHSDKIKLSRDKYYKENFKHISKLRSKWNKNNRHVINQYDNYKYHNDFNFKISKLLRCNLGRIIKLQNTIKSKRTLELLGCTIEQFKQHIEQQFKPEMMWDNHGQIWEIDHIKPCSSFDLSDFKQQEICFHYTNMQPLFKTTEIAESFGYINEIGNRNKSDNIYIHEII